MKEKLFSFLNYFIKFFAVILGLILFLYTFEKSFPTKEINQKFVEIKKNFEEISQKISGEEDQLPQKKIKLTIQFQSKIDIFNFRFFELEVLENDLFLKQELSDWKKFHFNEKDVEDLERLKEILEKENLFKNFKRIDHKFEFEVDKEKIRTGLLKWAGEKEIKELKELEAFLLIPEQVFGEVFFDEENLIRDIEIFSQNYKISIKVEKLEKSELAKEKRLENFIFSILKI